MVDEISSLRSTVTRLEQQQPISNPPSNTLSITDIVAGSLAHSGYESDASALTPYAGSGALLTAPAAQAISRNRRSEEGLQVQCTLAM